jgi:hypothetical protein
MGHDPEIVRGTGAGGPAVDRCGGWQLGGHVYALNLTTAGGQSSMMERLIASIADGACRCSRSGRRERSAKRGIAVASRIRTAAESTR